jgi:hypothetical protein
MSSPAVEIREISRDGILDLGFNQPLMPPPFSKSYTGSIKEATARRLVSLRELNVTRDVLEFKYRLRNDVIEARKIKYDLYIEEWEEMGMKIKIDFEDPLLVSYG